MFGCPLLWRGGVELGWKQGYPSWVAEHISAVSHLLQFVDYFTDLDRTVSLTTLLVSSPLLPRSWWIVFIPCKCEGTTSGHFADTHTLPPETYAVFFFWWLLVICSYSFWRRSKYFWSSLTVADPGWIVIFYDIQFFPAVRFVMSTLFEKGTFNHCGRSKASNSSHHGTYVFQTAFLVWEMSKMSGTDMYMNMHVFMWERMRDTWCQCLCVCVSVCLCVFMCGSSAMKVNAWTCAPATDRDLDWWD